jgi:hypothetical protein
LTFGVGRFGRGSSKLAFATDEEGFHKNITGEEQEEGQA